MISKNENKTYLFGVILVSAACFLLYCSMAYRIPMDKLCIPDEVVRQTIPFHIAQKGEIPTGFEMELNKVNGYGFSYASYPPLPALVSALFIKLASFFTSGRKFLVFSCRMTSVLAGTVSVFYAVRLGKLLFERILPALLFAAIIGLMPQVVFVCGYHNCDSVSLCFSVMVFYFMVSGSRNKWSISDCVKLALSMSGIVLTYYNAYGWCLAAVIFCICDYLRQSSADKQISAGEKKQFILIRSAVVAGIILMLTGWFFIRNALLYDGDFLAIGIRDKIADMTEKAGFEVIHCKGAGEIFESTEEAIRYWLFLTSRSFIGVFNAMDVLMPERIYRFYGILIGVSLAAALPYVFKNKDKRVFHLILMIPVVSTVFLSVYYSWATDYQPQGRYLMPMLPVLSYFMVLGISRLDKIREEVIFQITGKNSSGGNGMAAELKKNLLCGIVLALWILGLLAAFLTTIEPKVLF